MEHFETTLDLPSTLGQELLDCIKKTALRLMNNDKTISGFNVIANNFEVAGQVVKHAHFHILPRRKGDIGKQPSKRQLREQIANLESQLAMAKQTSKTVGDIALSGESKSKETGGIDATQAKEQPAITTGNTTGNDNIAKKPIGVDTGKITGKPVSKWWFPV